MPTQTNEQKKLSPEEAYNVLISQTFAPTFFQKLSSVYNITPANEQEAKDMLLTAGMLRNAQEANNTKEAADRTNFYSQAKDDLAQTLGYQTYGQPNVDMAVIKQAATQAAQNPLIKEAALVFADHLAQSMSQN